MGAIRLMGLILVIALAGGLAVWVMTPGDAPDADASASTGEATPTPASAEDMGFFITSVGPGDGGDLGGLEGADAHCQVLAEEVGAGDRVWRAYLSTQATDDEAAVNARDRIGEGPWLNARGLQIASDVDDLHYNNANINYEHALNERGEPVNSSAMGDSPSHHDILTGTRMDGTAFPPGEDRTCNNWTSSGKGSGFVGHHDRYSFDTPGSPWNAAHASQGCSQEDLEGTGGAGLFYCFAAR